MSMLPAISDSLSVTVKLTGAAHTHTGSLQAGREAEQS